MTGTPVGAPLSWEIRYIRGRQQPFTTWEQRGNRMFVHGFHRSRTSAEEAIAKELHRRRGEPK